MKKIAITGNMGTGKSFVTGCIKKHGVHVLDADVLAREVRTALLPEIARMFDCDSSDEKEIAAIVFSDDAKRQQLEDLLYPKMIEEMHAFFETHKEETIVCVETPLLFEKHWDTYFDEVWCVACSLETSLARLMAFRNFTKEEALARLQKQMSLEEKINRSHHVFYNDEEDDVIKQVEEKLKEERVVW